MSKRADERTKDQERPIVRTTDENDQTDLFAAFDVLNRLIWNRYCELVGKR